MGGRWKIKFFNPSEQEIDFDSFIEFPQFWFELVFFNFSPLKVNPTTRERIKQFARTSFNVLSVIALIPLELSLCLFSLVAAEDALTAAANVPNIATVVLIYQRALATFVNRERLNMIFDGLRGAFKAHEHVNSNYKIKQHLDSYLKLIRTYTFIIVFITLPVIVMPTISFLITGSAKLSINYWFPFDANTARNFTAAMAWTIFIAWTSATFLISVDSLLYALITVLAMEFDVLKADIADLKLLTKSDRMKKLAMLINRQNKIFDIADELQDIYGPTLLLSFVVSSLVLCYLAFIISMANDFAVYSMNGTLFSIISGQMLLLCYFGQKLIDSSSEIADGIYGCNWEDMHDDKFIKYLVLVMARSQSPKKLTAMGFSDVNLASFATVS